MSGFTRDTLHYGDRLVYVALMSKWDRYHMRCGCGRDWVTEHAEPAGFTVVRDGGSFVALTGPGLTEGVDEERLTTNALWQVVTGTPGAQDWFEPVQVFDRSETAESERKAADREHYDKLSARVATSREAPATAAQLKYLNALVGKVERERFDAEYAKAAQAGGLQPRKPGEKTQPALQRLSKYAARKLITALAGRS